MPADESFLEALTQEQLQKQLQAATDAGLSPAETEDRFQQQNFILSMKLLLNHYDGILPEGEAMPLCLAHLTEITETESQRILSEFMRRGWLDRDYALVEAGLSLLRDLDLSDALG